MSPNEAGCCITAHALSETLELPGKPPLVLLVCVGPRCDAEGRGRALLGEVQAAVATAFPEELAEGRLKVSTRECLRLCTRDPVVRIEATGDAFSDPDINELMKEITAALG